MNVKSYIEFINESIGANTMNRKPVEQLNNPEHNVQQPNFIATGRAGSIPTHWNSPPGTLAGARYGTNPSEKKQVMTYEEFMTAHKKYTNKKVEESEEFSWDDILGDTSARDDKWSELEKDMMALADKYSGDFGVDSYGVADAMYQILDGMFQKQDRK